MHKIYKEIISFCLMVFTVGVNAQSTEVEMAENFRGEGKIYVVIAVILIILFGIFYYLWRLDKKLKQVEKEEGLTEEK